MTSTPTAERIRVDSARLEQFVTDTFMRLGMPEDDARISAHGLVLSDLRGHESHGVSNNFLGGYVPASSPARSIRGRRFGSSSRPPSSRAGTATAAWASSSAIT